MCSSHPVLSLQTGTRREEKKMLIFSEVTVVLGIWDILLFSRAVKTCGLHRRGSCSCGRHTVFCTRRRRIIWLAMCLELLRKEASGNSESVGLVAEKQASNSATGLPNVLGWGLSVSWESPLIRALWVFAITSGSIPCTDSCSYYITFTPVMEIVGFKVWTWESLEPLLISICNA